MHCFDCGVDLLETKDKRALDSPAAVDVVKTWKLLLFVELMLMSALSLEVKTAKGLQRCVKKCFTAYRTYGRHYQVIDRRKDRIHEGLSPPQSLPAVMIWYHFPQSGLGSVRCLEAV